MTTGSHTEETQSNRPVRCRWWLLVLLGCVASLPILLWAVRSSPDPVYLGHPISYWIEPWQHNDQETPASVDAAFAKMDGRAVRWLVRQLEWQPSRTKERINNFIASFVSARPFKDRPDRREVAALALMKLGTRAKSAIPALEAASQRRIEPRSWTSRGVALGALMRLRGDALEPYLAQMKSASFSDWGSLALALGYQGTNAAIAVPLLADSVVKGGTNVFYLPAIVALGRIRSQPELSVPALVRHLRSTNLGERLSAIKALREFGSAATPALSTLTACLNDPDEFIRCEAICLFSSVDPAAARRAGMKCPWNHAHPRP